MKRNRENQPETRHSIRKAKKEERSKNRRIFLSIVAIPALLMTTLFTSGTIANWTDSESATNEFQVGVHGLQASTGGGNWTTSNSNQTVTLNFGGNTLWTPNQTRVATLDLRGDQRAGSVPFRILNMQNSDVVASGSNNITDEYSWEWHRIPSGNCSVNLENNQTTLLARGNTNFDSNVSTVSSQNTNSLTNFFSQSPRAQTRTCFILKSGANIPQDSVMNINWNIRSENS